MGEPTIQSPAESPHVLLMPPTARDAIAIEKILSGVDIGCIVCRSVAELDALIGPTTAALVVSEEALVAELAALGACLHRQSVWSDLQVIVLSRSGPESRSLEAALRSLGNVAVMERPVRVSTFVSVVRSAIRARARQVQVRDHISRQAESEAALQASERRLREVLDAERAARSEVEQASRMKDEFLATLSHELRNPLNAILGWSQILRMSPPTMDEVNEAIEIIERNARAQSQIIEDLLDMSRIISGKVRLDVQRIDLAAVIQAAIQTTAPAAEAKGVRVKPVLDPLASTVSGDPNRLQQVFWNLFSNAVKFTPRGGTVQILLERVNSHLEVSVIDSGEGIDPEFLPFVFDRFRQADATTTRQHGGLGLGLAIVRQLVELHGGTIRAKSAGLGAGSTFVVALPYAAIRNKDKDEADLPRRHPTASASATHTDDCSSLDGVKILIVDDEPDARALMRRLLEDCDAIVFDAANARDAVELLQSRRPDVLVSDIGMPNEDGYALIRRVRALSVELGGKTPAVALTAYARSEDRINAVLAGFNQHLAKPVEPAELIAIVASLAQRND